MRRARILGGLLLLACARRPAPNPAEADPASAKEQRVRAFRHCYEVTVNLVGTEGPGHEARIARACADVFSEPACSSVMRDPPRPPKAIAGAIAGACRDAYCPRLIAPRPSLCAMRELPPPVELGRRWHELQNRILSLELGVGPEELETLAPPMNRPFRKEIAPGAPVLPPFVVRLKPEGDGARVSIEGRTETLFIELRGKTDALAALFRAARAELPAGTGAIVDAPPSFNDEFVLRASEGLSQAGFRDIAYENPYR